jgi:hypothetical protein
MTCIDFFFYKNELYLPFQKKERWKNATFFVLGNFKIIFQKPIFAAILFAADSFNAW